MLVLDTDHLSEFERGSTGAAALRTKHLAAGGDEVATIVSAEEQLRGWLAYTRLLLQRTCSVGDMLRTMRRLLVEVRVCYLNNTC